MYTVFSWNQRSNGAVVDRVKELYCANFNALVLWAFDWRNVWHIKSIHTERLSRGHTVAYVPIYTLKSYFVRLTSSLSVSMATLDSSEVARVLFTQIIPQPNIRTTYIGPISESKHLSVGYIQCEIAGRQIRYNKILRMDILEPRLVLHGIREPRPLT